MAGAEITRKTNGAGNVDARRPAEAQALPLHEVEDYRQGFRIRDAVGVIGCEAFEVGGNPPLADAFGDGRALRLQFAVGIVFVERSAFGVRDADLDVGPPGAQPLRHAGERAAGTDGADETVHLAARLLPDLPGCRLDMCQPVGDVVELVGPDGACG